MGLGLVELIDQLKKELGQLQESSTPLFSIETVDVELKFVVDKTLEAGGSTTKWALFAVEAKGNYKDEKVNTVKLTLKPLLGTNFTTLVAAVPPNLIRGRRRAKAALDSKQRS